VPTLYAHTAIHGLTTEQAEFNRTKGPEDPEQSTHFNVGDIVPADVAADANFAPLVGDAIRDYHPDSEQDAGDAA
jgi:hypothetical protein